MEDEDGGSNGRFFILSSFLLTFSLGVEQEQHGFPAELMRRYFVCFRPRLKQVLSSSHSLFIFCVLFIFFYQPSVPVRKVLSAQVGKLVTITGIITRITEVFTFSFFTLPPFSLNFFFSPCSSFQPGQTLNPCSYIHLRSLRF